MTSDAKKTDRPKYNLLQNTAYMITVAWTTKNKTVIGICLLLAVLHVAGNLLGLYITPTILQAIEDAVPLRELIFIILAFAGAMLLVHSLTDYVDLNSFFVRIGIRVISLRRVMTKLMTTSYPNTENQDMRRHTQQALEAVGFGDESVLAMWETFRRVLQSIIGFIIFLVILAVLEVWMILTVLVTTVISFFVNRHLGQWWYRHRDEESEYWRRMNYISEKSSDHTLAKDIRLFGMAGWLMDMYNSTLRLLTDFTYRGLRITIWGGVLDVALTFLRNGLAYFILINHVLGGQLSASQFLLYFTAVGGFTAWITGILTGVNELRGQSLRLSTAREFLEFPEPFRVEDGMALAPDIDLPYEIKLRNVSFRYPGASEDTIKNISLIIRPGEKLAIVGLNGAGKTTLIKLISGFYDPTEGEVLLNGANIRQYNRWDYYRHFGVVFQDFSLLPISIAENISQSLPDDIDLDRMRDSAEKAGLREAIEDLPDGYNSKLGKEVYENGIQLSGGQTQRLMLARALYKNAPIIILDEPTAALDPIAERDMYLKYNELTQGRISVYISHRLSSTRFCDRILFLDSGAITEEGRHEDLVKAKGRYAELFEIQSHYYKEDVLLETKETRHE